MKVLAAAGNLLDVAKPASQMLINVAESGVHVTSYARKQASILDREGDLDLELFEIEFASRKALAVKLAKKEARTNV